MPKRRWQGNRPRRGVDLVFSDIVMPGKMDGLAFAHRVREIRPDLPVFAGHGATATPRPMFAATSLFSERPYEIHELSRADRENCRGGPGASSQARLADRRICDGVDAAIGPTMDHGRRPWVHRAGASHGRDRQNLCRIDFRKSTTGCWSPSSSSPTRAISARRIGESEIRDAYWRRRRAPGCAHKGAGGRKLPASVRRSRPLI